MVPHVSSPLPVDERFVKLTLKICKNKNDILHVEVDTLPPFIGVGWCWFGIEGGRSA